MGWCPISFTHGCAGALAQGTHDSFAVSYGTGEVRGTVGSDAVRLGALRLPRQGLGLATDTDGGFCSAACDGLMVHPSACAPDGRTSAACMAWVAMPMLLKC